MGPPRRAADPDSRSPRECLPEHDNRPTVWHILVHNPHLGLPWRCQMRHPQCTAWAALVGGAPRALLAAAARDGGSLFQDFCTALHCSRGGGGRRDGLDWWPAKGPRRPPWPGPPRTLPARSSPRLSAAPAQDDVEGPATDSTPGLDSRARPSGDPDTCGGCAFGDHCPDAGRGPLAAERTDLPMSGSLPVGGALKCFTYALLSSDVR